MKVDYLVQVYDKLTKHYITLHKGKTEERAKIMACKSYNTRAATATTRVLRVSEEVIHTFRRKEK